LVGSDQIMACEVWFMSGPDPGESGRVRKIEPGNNYVAMNDLAMFFWPRGLSRPKFCGLFLGLEGPGFGLEGSGLVEAEVTRIIIMILSYLIVVLTIDCFDFKYFEIV